MAAACCRGKLFVRLKEDGESIVVRIEEPDRVLRLQADPTAFYITDHYAGYPWMLVRLSAVAQDDLADLIHDAWRIRHRDAGQGVEAGWAGRRPDQPASSGWPAALDR
jgi:hypothetical protein